MTNDRLTIPEHLIHDTLIGVVDLYLIPTFERLGMNATGEWRESVEVRVNGYRGEIWARPYTKQLVEGAPPGTTPSIPKLTRWAIAKFGYDEQRARNTAFAVRTKIEREGTSWYPNKGTELVEVLNSQEVQDYINERIGSYLSAHLENILLDELKQIQWH